MALSDSYIKKEFTPAEKTALKKKEEEQAYLSEAGLEDRDTAKLRKTMLSADEAVCAKTEQQENILQRRGRKEDWDEYVDEKRRWGKALHHSEIIRKLRGLIPTLVCADGETPNSISLYYYDPHRKFVGRVGGYVNMGWIHGGYNPEYEVDICDKYGRAIAQKRGWRTTLVRAICHFRPPDRELRTLAEKQKYHLYKQPQSLLTEEQALANFGPPTNGATASNWRQHLYKFRNRIADPTLYQ